MNEQEVTTVKSGKFKRPFSKDSVPSRESPTDTITPVLTGDHSLYTI